MPETSQNEMLLLKVRNHVKKFFNEKVSTDYAYHNFKHTLNVVDAAQLIGEQCQLVEASMEEVILAAWFHDTGIYQGPENHEKASVKIMRDFLSNEGLTEDRLKIIEGCIMSTQMPQNPKTIGEKVMVDADLFHLSSYTYFSEWELMKCEHELIKEEKIDDMTWLEGNLNFFKDHTYFTEYGKEVLQKEKEKNFATMERRINWIKQKDKKISSLKKKLKKNEKNSSTELKPEKARETMLRITSRNHLELSTMADSKANIMISINAIILSIVVSVLFRKLEESPFLIIPAIILTLVCLLTIVFAVLATRPNLSSGKFDDKDVMSKKTNLLFFGNFHKMPLSNYMWGMKEMLKDPDYLYGSMIKDIYFLGVILGKKYRLLRITYTIFMFGFVIAVLSFVIAFILKDV